MVAVGNALYAVEPNHGEVEVVTPEGCVTISRLVDVSATQGHIVPTAIAHDGSWRTIVSGLSFPTAMTFGDRNTLYISNKGFGQPTNTAGEIVKVQIPDNDD